MYWIDLELSETETCPTCGSNKVAKLISFNDDEEASIEVTNYRFCHSCGGIWNIS